MTLDDWAETAWTLLSVRDITLHNYKLKYSKHIKPVFGNNELTSISKKDVQLWILSIPPVTGIAVLPVLSSLFREAVNYELLSVNPCLGVRKKPHTTPRRDFMALDQVYEVTPRYRQAALFLALHGLRISEAWALTPDDISNGYVHITRTIHSDTTKSGRYRRVPFIDVGTIKVPRSRGFRLSLRPYTIHSLRKTYAYTLKSQGVHITTIQSLLGHASIQTTMIYLETLDDEYIEVGNKLKALLPK